MRHNLWLLCQLSCSRFFLLFLLRVSSKFLPHIENFCSLPDLLGDLPSFIEIHGMFILRRILEDDEPSIWLSYHQCVTQSYGWYLVRTTKKTWDDFRLYSGLSRCSGRVGSRVVSTGSWVGVFTVNMDGPSCQCRDPAGK